MLPFISFQDNFGLTVINDARLKIYDGTTFRIAGGSTVSATQPNMVAGDPWIHNEENKLYFFDGTDVIAVGPTIQLATR